MTTRTMVEVAASIRSRVRIGVNWGSLDQALLTKMRMKIQRLPILFPLADVMMEHGGVGSGQRSRGGALRLRRDQILMSAKVSGVRVLIEVRGTGPRYSHHPPPSLPLLPPGRCDMSFILG